ncbi:Spy Predicted O-linked N-acetylglucosamine transferase, SPINDLY family [Burkholderiaceae bacterium]
MSQQLQNILQVAIEAFNTGDFKKSEKLLSQYVKKAPDEFDPIHLLAVVNAFNFKHHEAIKWYRRAIQLNPNDAQALSNLATSLNSTGNYQESLEIQEKAIKLDPHNAEFWYNAGNILCDMGMFENSFRYYEKSLALNPYSHETLNNYGKALFDLGRFSESITYYDQALQLNPNFLECLINKGVSLKDLKRYDEAIACFDRALMIQPYYAEAFSNKGIVLCALKKFDEAVHHFDKSIALKADYAEAWSNKGVVLHHELKHFEDAIRHHDQAIKIKPSYAEAWSNKAATLNDVNRYDEALLCYNKALALKPNLDWVYGNLLHTKMKLCTWNSFEEDTNNLTQKIQSHNKIAQPFVPLFLIDNPHLHHQCAINYINDLYPPNPILGLIPKRNKKTKIRVAYFSADFGRHAVSALTAELFELHNKNDFEVIAFSFSLNDKSEMHLRLSRAFDQFIDARALSDREIAQLAREMQIDIAIDLGGFTGENRTGPFAFRVAPIQVNYLGYPGTLGANYFDYIIADHLLIPIESQKYFSEKVVYLPNSYQANDRQRPIAEKKYSRQELGLPEGCIVFSCFNNNYKILPTTFASWMRILKSVDGSVLWLLEDNPLGAKKLKEEAQKHGVSGERLIFALRTSIPEHLARHHQADLFIDTYPYNAHTTASDALWAGLPVLTMMGKSFASRVAGSLLNAIGLPQLITKSQEEFEELAIALAKNPQKLASIREHVANNRLTAPLFDTPRFTKHLEAAYLKMYERYQLDLEPDHIYIEN